MEIEWSAVFNGGRKVLLLLRRTMVLIQDLPLKLNGSNESEQHYAKWKATPVISGMTA